MYELAKRNYLTQHGFNEIHLKAVLFDMDGVLYDSMHNHADAWAYAMSKFGLGMTPEDVYQNEGRTGKSTINLFARRYWGREVTDEEAQKIYAVKANFFNSCPDPTPMPGAYELLKKIKDSGIQVLLVTGSGQRSLLAKLNQSFPGIFEREKMVTSFDVEHGKPNPEPYLKGLKKAGVAPYEAVVVENAPLGVRAATAAEVFTIAVNTGPLPNGALLDEKANLIFPSVQELCNQWEQIANTLL